MLILDLDTFELSVLIVFKCPSWDFLYVAFCHLQIQIALLPLNCDIFISFSYIVALRRISSPTFNMSDESMHLCLILCLAEIYPFTVKQCISCGFSYTPITI